MATAKDVLKVARAEIGTKESPSGSNRVKYNTWYYGKEVSGSAYPWCMAFVQWCFNQAGMPLPYKTASCSALMRWSVEHGRWVVSDYKPGDVLLFDFGGDGDPDHVGILDSIEAGKLVSIEGNTSVTSNDNGGCVMERSRRKSTVVGAYRPDYSEEAEKMDNTPSEWAEEAVTWAKESGLLKGDQYGNLQLHENLTREQMCVFLYRYSKL